MTKWSKRSLCAVALSLGWWSGVAAQESRSFVLPSGTVRVSAGSEYASYDALFGGSGRERLGESIRGPLVASDFPPLGPFYTALNTFFHQTAGAPGATPLALEEDDVSLGEVDAALFLSRVRVPMRLDVGVIPRLQVGVEVPVVRGRQLVERLSLIGPTMGANPDATGNAQLLGRVGGNGTTLGGLPLLPTRGSVAGVELQRRVRAANGGDSLSLPHPDSVPGSVLQSFLRSGFGVDSLRSAAELWRLGDLEVHARVSILDPLRGAPLPDSLDGTALRVAAFGGVRLPTGLNPDTATFFGRDPDVGLSGYELGVAAELFLGPARWVSVTLRRVALTSGEVSRRVAPRDAPLSVTDPPRRVRWLPGDTLQLHVAPRFRLADPISVGLDYDVQLASDGRYESLDGAGDASVLGTEGGMAHRIGGGIAFSSLPAYFRGESNLPIEVSLTYGKLLSGPAGMPAESRIRLEGSVYLSLWGRGIRRE